MKIVRLSAVALLIGCVALPALAADPAYLDDRSTAASLVRSFYNAVNLHQYARAYSYFGQDGAPRPYEQFAQGYQDTQFVSVATGEAQSDGTAGSIYYTIPVAIDSVSDDGSHKQFTGCYVARLMDPDAQDPPVTPMFISDAKLHPANGNIARLLPDCSNN